MKQSFSFETLIDDSLINIFDDLSLDPIDNKNLLTLINNFEEGEWRYQQFLNFVWDNIAQTSLSYEERKSLVNKSHTKLVEAAKNLRLTDSDEDPSRGSELAEVVLYGIMKHKFNALPVVPKIFYKQNSQDPAKGADSVHIVIEPDESENDFTIWLGEAKFYNSIENSRLHQIVDSVEESLRVEKIRKENSLITNLSDLEHVIDDQELVEDIKNALSQDVSIDTIKPILKIPILLLHECQITNTTTELSDSYRDEIKESHKERAIAYFDKQIEKISDLHKYSEIVFHLVLLPVPSKSHIVDSFIDAAKFYKGQN